MVSSFQGSLKKMGKSAKESLPEDGERIKGFIVVSLRRFVILSTIGKGAFGSVKQSLKKGQGN